MAGLCTVRCVGKGGSLLGDGCLSDMRLDLQRLDLHAFQIPVLLSAGVMCHAAYSGGAVVVGGLLAGPFGAMVGGVMGASVRWQLRESALCTKTVHDNVWKMWKEVTCN